MFLKSLSSVLLFLCSCLSIDFWEWHHVSWDTSLGRNGRRWVTGSQEQRLGCHTDFYINSMQEFTTFWGMFVLAASFGVGPMFKFIFMLVYMVMWRTDFAQTSHPALCSTMCSSEICENVKKVFAAWHGQLYYLSFYLCQLYCCKVLCIHSSHVLEQNSVLLL